jgi:hypothetical protein
MTEELEKKLNELLGLKKQLEEITEEKQKTATASALGRYRKESIINLLLFCTGLGFGWALIVLGAVAMARQNDVINISAPAILLVGLIVLIAAKLQWIISRTKLSILQEMKQFEIRVTELLKK